MDDELRKHPADRDYSQWNAPDEAALITNLESAILLSDMFQGRRGVGPDGRGLRSVTPGFPSDKALYVQELPRTPAPPLDNISALDYERKFDAAVKSMQTEPGELGAVDRALAEDCMAVIRDRVRRLRESGVGDTVVGTHACNSIDLGLVGIAKLMGAE